MKNLLYIYTACLLLATSSASACDINGDTGFLPENNLNISVDDKSMRNNITEESFNTFINLLYSHYSPIVKELGATLVFDRRWRSGMVNAYARRKHSERWEIIMHGGLARHKLLSHDGFALVICHELGHHLAGAPKNTTGPSWASNEGQSDYFATLKCFRRVFENENNAEVISKMNVPDIARDQCASAYSLQTDRDLCIRSVMAGKNLAVFMASVKKTSIPHLATPTNKIVRATYSSHPAAQCRLDTYFHGALCAKSIEEKLSNINASDGACNRSDNMDVGVRPLCWFKPAISI